MKKTTFIIIILLVLFGLAFYVYNSIFQHNSNMYTSQKTSTNNNRTNSQAQEVAKSAEESEVAEVQAKQDKQSQQNQKATTNAEATQQIEAEEIASFSTKIYTKDSSRQNNITITCTSLNDTDVASGAEFSFCNTVGPASSSKGYKKADIFTNGKKTKGYGGGNCQVSTTLYNAVLHAPDLKVTERHEHSNKVPYIQSGKDAAVAYGSYDFKFINNTGSTIRIKASNTPDSVDVRIEKI